MARKLRVVDSAGQDEQMARIARAAFLMRQRGLGIYEIAEQLQVTEEVVRSGMRITLEKASQLITDGTRMDALALESARLDTLQNAVWDQAVAGDVRSVETVLKIIGQRAKLLGLEAGPVENINQTLVVAGDSKAYIEALKSITSGREALSAD